MISTGWQRPASGKVRVQQHALCVVYLCRRSILTLTLTATHISALCCVPPCRAAPDPHVTDLVLDCVALIAAALPPGLIADLLLPRLAETGTQPEVQAGMVRLVSAVVRWGTLIQETVNTLNLIQETVNALKLSQETVKDTLVNIITEFRLCMFRYVCHVLMEETQVCSSRGCLRCSNC